MDPGAGVQKPLCDGDMIFDSCVVGRAADEISGGGFVMTFYELLLKFEQL